jgi:imidazolonepropionase-like amidohydrolase
MIAIRAARMFDGVTGDLTPEPLVLVESGRVLAVGSGGAAPAEAELVDLGAATLLPGLVDAHVHLAFDASADPVGRLSTVDDEDLLAGMRGAAAAALAAGITTVRDLGDRGYLALRLRDELAGGDPTAGPLVLAAGTPITVTRGHCWFLGGEADGVDGVRAAVREHAERGVDVIKVMATGGDLTPGTLSHEPSYAPAELRAAADEAHRHGLPITAHAHGTAGIANVADAGFDMVEHCTFRTADGAQAEEAVIESILRSGLVVSATLGAVPGFPIPPKIAALLPQFVAVFRRLRAAGVPTVCSSDAGIGPPKPHDVLPYGAAMMVNVNGYSTVEALRGVTSAAAAACGLGDRKGRIAAGYDADLLAVDGDPLANISALRNVSAVFRAGQRVR